jgi:hypothetical protein
VSNEERRAWIEQITEVLQTAGDPADLEPAAAQLAASDDPQALDRLGAFLSSGEFLARLDDLSEPAQKLLHLRHVFSPLIEHPSPEVAGLCEKLAENEAFRSEDDRTPLLLDALAKVTPMSDAAVELFRTTNDEGYASANALRLVANGSPPALSLFVSMMSDRDVDVDRRVDLLHQAIVPYRTRLSTLQMVAELLARDLEEPVAQGAIESVFDFHWQWFGSRPPEPPAWRAADAATLQFLIELGEANRRANLPATLLQAIEGTVGVARALLARRKRP